MKRKFHDFLSFSFSSVIENHGTFSSCNFSEDDSEIKLKH